MSLSLAHVDSERVEALRRTLGALADGARVTEEHLGAGELATVFDSMLGQPAWVLASLLDVVLAERRGAKKRSERVIDEGHRSSTSSSSPELVWSTDTGSRVPARKTRYVIQDLFARASRRVLIAGYSFDNASDLFEPLFTRAEQLLREQQRPPSVRVVLDCSRVKSSEELAEEGIARLAAAEFMRTCWTSDVIQPELLYYRPSTERTAKGWALYSMHAKCIVVDGSAALVGSANFSKRGRDRNLEAGALIRDHHFVQSLLAAWEDVRAELVQVPESEWRIASSS